MPDIHGHRSLKPVSIAARKATYGEQKRRELDRDVRGPGGGGLRPVWVEVRNGLPDFKPYVYRGTGYDQYPDDDWEPDQ